MSFDRAIFVPTPFDVATGDMRLGGVIVEVDGSTGRATSIQRLQVTEAEVAGWEREGTSTPS